MNPPTCADRRAQGGTEVGVAIKADGWIYGPVRGKLLFQFEENALAMIVTIPQVGGVDPVTAEFCPDRQLPSI